MISVAHRVGVVVQCEHGLVLSTSNYGLTQAFGPDGEEIKSWHGDGNHFANFLDAVRSRKRSDLHADVLDGHLSSALCHTGGISHQLGEPRPADEILQVGRQERTAAGFAGADVRPPAGERGRYR